MNHRCKPSPQIAKISLLVAGMAPLLGGCAEGPLWRLGYLSPWVQRTWSDEEKIATTLFARRQQLREMVDQAKDQGPQAQTEASRRLAEIVRSDPILLMRIEATRLIAEFSTPEAADGLTFASRDPDSDVRLAAVEGWRRRGGQDAATALGEMVGGDTNVDIRLAAVRALGDFPSPVTVNALALVLDDHDPALQVRATESLERVTGQKLGPDVTAWKSYVAGIKSGPAQTAERPGTNPVR